MQHISRRTALTAAGGALLASWLPGAPEARAEYAPCSRTVRLACGRRLGYRDYGQPDGPLVFYFHGTPGSRLELSLCEGECRASAARIVSVDRPGMGLSTYQSGRRILDWPCDVERLADALGYAGQPFGIIGMSGGAPYALACAWRLPHRVRHVAIISGHAPMNAPGTCPGNQDKLIELVERRPRLAKGVFRLATKRLDRRPDRVLDQVTAGWTEADQRLVLCNPRRRSQLIANLKEAARCGPSGVVADIQLLARPWCFPLSGIEGVGVSIWQGACDGISTLSMGRYFHKHIDGSQLFIDPKGGHVTTLKHHIAEALAMAL